MRDEVNVLCACANIPFHWTSSFEDMKAIIHRGNEDQQNAFNSVVDYRRVDYDTQDFD